MKYTLLKKAVALFAAVILVLSLPLGIFAGAVRIENYPIIYLPDISEIVIYQNPNSLSYKEVFNVQSSDFLKSAVGVVTGLVAAANDADKGAVQVNSAVKSMLGNIECDEHGDTKNPSLGVWSYLSPIGNNINSEIYTDNLKALADISAGSVGEDRIFVFNYDWRLDPLSEAAKLCDYIEKILVTTHSDMVRLLSGGFGGIIANSYLYTYEDHAEKYVSSCVFLDSMLNGTSIIGDIMSGHLVKTVIDSLHEAQTIFDLRNAYDVITGADVGAALARYMKQDPGGIVSGIVARFLGDNNTSGLVSWFALTLAFDIIQDEGMLDKVGKGYKEMLILADNGLYNGGIGEILRNMPGMWAMVPVDVYDDAVKFMFGSEKEIDEDLYAKMTAYREVINATERTLKKTQLNGINVDIVAGYGMQVLPVTASTNEQSDGLVATRYAGAGATTGDISSKLKLSKQCRYGNHDHMEPGKAVDAATCYLPENTWFIKSHKHMDYDSPTAAEFVFWLLSGVTQRNVYQNPAFPQYMQKAVIGEKVYAYSVPSESEARNYTYGDIDIDGKVTASDARLALRYSVGLEAAPSKIILLVGDVSGDGKIDASDARLILRYSVGLDTKFAAVE